MVATTAPLRRGRTGETGGAGCSCCVSPTGGAGWCRCGSPSGGAGSCCVSPTGGAGCCRGSVGGS